MRIGIILFVAVIVCFGCCSASLAVSSEIVRHSSQAELAGGETENTIINSRGFISLARQAEELTDEFKGVWSINTIVVKGQSIYIGTSPNGGIFEYENGQLKKLYSAVAEKSQAEEHLANEHIFAMALDGKGRLLAGISGDNCRLMRFDDGKWEVIFEPDDTKYIFAIETADDGSIFLGTGPAGKIYRKGPKAEGFEVLYQSGDKNILSLAAGDDGFLYAGSAERGLVYKINVDTKKAEVLYDSEQSEITAMLFDENGQLYAASTAAEVVSEQNRQAERFVAMAGRAEAGNSCPNNANGQADAVKKLDIANTDKGLAGKGKQGAAKALPAGGKGRVSYIYKITKDGFVREVFSRQKVFFIMKAQNGQLYIGSGPDAELFAVEPATEQAAVVYKDDSASQITAIASDGQELFVGTANPAKLIKIANRFAGQGSYESQLIDAGQPARWGKLQIDADIPAGAVVEMVCRSGNVADINDPTFSDWTQVSEIAGPVQLNCPVGRFCQYKLILSLADQVDSPLVREIAVAYTVDNLAPKVESVSAERLKETAKKGVFKINYTAEDDNKDKLIYKIDFRKLGRQVWIEIADEIETPDFEWDTKTVEDGRYELRVIASDSRSNTAATKLMGSRISEPIVADNTAPDIVERTILKEGQRATLKLVVSDKFSVVGLVEYTVDSNSKWIGALPDDMVYDTTEEKFTIVAEDLEPGEHIVAVKISDDVGNTAYKSFEIQVGQ